MATILYPKIEPSDYDLDSIEYEDSLGEDAIINEVRYVFFTGKSHTRCSYGCLVEKDGQCPHGHKSLALEWGLI